MDNRFLKSFFLKKKFQEEWGREVGNVGTPPAPLVLSQATR